MKRTLIFFVVVFLSGVVGCGSSGGDGIKIEGPLLSIDEAKSIVVDQFFVNGGLDDEYAGKGEFSVYLRDAITGKDIACATQTDGMKKLSLAGIYYGDLSIPLREVESEHLSESMSFEIVFVEQDGDGCPKKIEAEDDIVGISDKISFDALLNKPIQTADGLASVVLRPSSSEVLDVAPMPPAVEDVFAIDKLYFEDDSEEESRYVIFADRIVEDNSSYQCQIDDAFISKIHFGGILYSALDFPFSCFDPKDPAFASTKIKIGIYKQLESGPELMAETDVKAIGDLIGEKTTFAGNNGYITFRSVQTVK